MNEFRITSTGFYRTRDGRKAEVVYIDPGHVSLPIVYKIEEDDYPSFFTCYVHGARFRGQEVSEDLVSPWTDNTPGASLQAFQWEVHELAMEKGFWTDVSEVTIVYKIAKIHEELSEALRAYERHDGELSDKIPDVSMFAEELADVALRTLDLAEFCRIDLGKVMQAKHEYNKTRPYQHKKEA